MIIKSNRKNERRIWRTNNMGIYRIKIKMYSIRDVHNHEKSVYKGHNCDIKYDEFKDTHSNKKLLDII